MSNSQIQFIGWVKVVPYPVKEEKNYTSSSQGEKKTILSFYYPKLCENMLLKAIMEVKNKIPLTTNLYILIISMPQ